MTDTAQGVTIVATPERLVIDPGPGQDPVTCTPPIKPYAPAIAAADQQPTCSVTYLRSSRGQPDSAYPMTVSIVWSGRWSTGGAFTNFDTTISTTTPINIRVAEGQVLN